MKKPRISLLYDQGSSSIQEDGLFWQHPFYGVFDGTSAPFSPSNPPRLFGPEELTGGEFLARRAEKFFRTLSPHFPLLPAVNALNKRIASLLEVLGLNLQFADQLPGLTLAVAKIDEAKVEIVQLGDCYAVWGTLDGKIHTTRNQVRCHDSRIQDEIGRRLNRIALQMGINLGDAGEEERKKIRGRMWDEFLPDFRKARRENINNPNSSTGFGFLNGQAQFSQMLFSTVVNREELSFLILFTDGFLPWFLIKTESDEKLAELICSSFQNGGLEKILRMTRNVEAGGKTTSHIDFSEATAIALQF